MYSMKSNFVNNATIKPVQKLVKEVNKLSHTLHYRFLHKVKSKAKIPPSTKDFCAFLCYCMKTLDKTTFHEIFL
ncbi:uncharacterized protein LOC110225071 [Arabidopsis lyrata subsp. lyrata]|uniref:uncharacterized protein LOC110225071 n=1 Tax=Arabidopsis lyrata subsp. lyrata TaxID=81972 RepID=UPI000A29D854|nr:uncharacterized protein LOC110225071 [Arabidopsis lyrata subsp. lyrata]|eukprot:XP_020869419.1 uncharacterized protein LOC110225071 [Arabidopsis lyrata subsp. lyrata]